MRWNASAITFGSFVKSANRIDVSPKPTTAARPFAQLGRRRCRDPIQHDPRRLDQACEPLGVSRRDLTPVKVCYGRGDAEFRAAPAPDRFDDAEIVRLDRGEIEPGRLGDLRVAIGVIEQRGHGQVPVLAAATPAGPIDRPHERLLCSDLFTDLYPVALHAHRIPGLPRTGRRQAAVGSIVRRPSNRLKSLSVVARMAPCSMVKAARCASMTSGPRA